MTIHQRLAFILSVGLIASLAFCDSHKMPDSVLSAKTAIVISRLGNRGAGKEKADPDRAKGKAESELKKWGKYQIVDSVEKADLVLVVVEGYVAATETNNLPMSQDYAHIDRPDVLSDTLSVYKGGTLDESSEPLWRGTETTDDYPSEKVIKKFRKAVEKASK